MLTIILDIIVVLAAFIDNLKYFLLCRNGGKKAKVNMKKFLFISIGARVVILAACLIKADTVFTVVYVIGLAATSLAYYLRKGHKLELNIWRRK